MKLPLDTGVAGSASQVHRAAGHDVEWCAEWPEDPGDEAILARAFEEQRIVVTLDKDFGELAVLHRQPYVGIVRLSGIKAQQQGERVLEIISRYGDELTGGAIVTIEPGRIRIRPSSG